MTGAKNGLLLKRTTDQLHTYRHTLGVKPAGQRQGGQTGNVDHNRINVAQVHSQRVGQSLTHRQCRGGCHRPQQKVIGLKGVVKGLTDQTLGLQGFLIISVKVAAGKYKVAQHDALFHFHTEALGAGLKVNFPQRVRLRRFVAVFNAVKPGQIGAGLGAGDNIISGNGVLHNGERKDLYRGAQIGQCVGSGTHSGGHLRVNTLAEVILRNTDLLALHILGAPHSVQIQPAAGHRGAVLGILAPDHIKHRRHIRCRTGNGPNLIQRRSIMNKAGE